MCKKFTNGLKRFCCSVKIITLLFGVIDAKRSAVCSQASEFLWDV